MDPNSFSLNEGWNQSRASLDEKSTISGTFSNLETLSSLDENEDLLTNVHDAPKPRLFRLHGYSYMLLKWPIWLFIVLILTLNFLVYLLIRKSVVIYERFIVWKGPPREIRRRLTSATTYHEWMKAAEALDAYFGLTRWKSAPSCPHYDAPLIQSVVKKLKSHVGDFSTLQTLCLESACKSNLGGVEHTTLYSYCYSGTKALIEQYYYTTLTTLDALYQSALPLDAKLRFFKKSSQLYGRSALSLSGGAAFGCFHAGVVKALLEAKMLPKVITGSSAGAFFAAMVCCRTDEELQQVLNSDFHSSLALAEGNWYQLLRLRVTQGVFFEHAPMKEKILWATLGNMTFLEAYQRTSRILNIPVVSTDHRLPTKLLNYLSTPDVLIWSAVLASCAIPGVLHPVQLMYKHRETKEELPFTALGQFWQDGTLRKDIPTKELHRKFNVNFTIVSQVNPHIQFFFFDGIKANGVPSAHRGGQGWRGGFLLTVLEHYLKLNLVKWLRLLRDLNLAPLVFHQDLSAAFLQKFHGNVTILPDTSIRNYLFIFNNPSKKDLQDYLSNGQRNTWLRLEIIKNRVSLEQTLYGYYHELRKISKSYSIKNGNETSD